jgi:transcriptional regulator with XRE-family HTH domain
VSNLGNKEVIAKNIKYYMQLNGKSRNDICNDLGFKYTTLVDWENGKTYPRIDKIELMANYFGIQKSDLIEERNESSKNTLPPLTPKDERSIQKRLESVLNDLMPENNAMAYFDGDEPMSDDDKELLRISLENTMRLAKQMAKQKFTPKKHRE